MDFKQYRELIRKQYAKYQFRFIANVDPDLLWETYLNSFPEETRQQHNCNCCKQFIRNCGALVDIAGNEIVTIWDTLEGKGDFERTGPMLRELVLKYGVSAKRYFTPAKVIGTDSNNALLVVDGKQTSKTITWNHFSVETKSFMKMKEDDIPSKSGELNQQKGVFLRSLKELTLDAINIVLELIAERHVHRGEQYLETIKKYRNRFESYSKFPKNETSLLADLRVWDLFYDTSIEVARLGNSVIGTLLYDIVEGKKDLSNCVHAFNYKMSPENFMRVKPVFTAKQAQAAAKAISDLGLEKALERRFATIGDLNANDVLFLNETTTTILPPTGVIGLLDGMAASAGSVSVESLKGAKELKISEFTDKILKESQRVEVYFDGKNQNNLVSLIATNETEKRKLFKWDNLFSWSYADALADSSLREKVKQAGGSIEGELRISLGWHNHDDLDLHLRHIESKHVYGRSIAYDKNKMYHSIYHGGRSAYGGVLDVDANNGNLTNTPVENIIFKDLHSLPNGEYVIAVNQYTKRAHNDNTFTLELEYKGEVYTFEGVNPSKSSSNGSGEHVIHTFRFMKSNTGIKVLNPEIGQTSGTISKEIWGINTNQFHDVNVITNSPNYWEDNKTGNHHLFFFINKAKNEGLVRGIFNEFLHSDLLGQHRKTFEALGSKLNVEMSNEQLSGLGFSSTFENDIIVRVTRNGKQELFKLLF